MTAPPLEKIRLLAISDAAPSRNGAGAYYLDLLEQMQGKLAATCLYSPTIDDDGRWQAGLVLPLPGDKTQKLCFPNPLAMGRLYRDFKPDIVVIATPGVYGVIGAWYARRHGVPYLTGMHTSFEQLTELYWPQSLQGKIVETYFKLSNGTLFKHTEAVLGNAEPILAQAEAMGAPETRLIGTPLAAEFIRPPHAHHTGTLESCLFAGRLAKEKNIDALLQAVTDFPDIRFSIAGDGPYRDQIEQAAATHANLQYLGWLDRDDLRRQVDQHDALLLPSFFETFGTIALEAMAREKLVFVSSGCGITHWDRLLPGLIVIDADGLSHSLDKTRRQPQQALRTLAATAKAIAVAWNDDVMNRWGHILRETIANHAAQRQ